MLDFYKKYYFYSECRKFFEKYTLESPLIVCACGFEQRTYRLFELLQTHNPRGNVKVLIADLRYEASPGDPYAPKARRIISSNMKVIKSMIEARGWKYKICPCKFFDAAGRYTAHEGLHNYLSENGTWSDDDVVEDVSSSRGQDVILDISSMPRAMMFPLFKELYNGDASTNFFVTFTEIEPLGSKESQVASYWQPQWVPGFEPQQQANGNEIRVWLPILGFDYRRVTEILERFSRDRAFHEIYPVVGFPSVRPLETDNIVKIHKTLFDLYHVPFENIIYVPIQDPFQLALTLSDFVRDIAGSVGKSVRFVISPLGSKPQSIGACLTALNNPNVSLLAVWPRSYNPLSAQNGESYIYWIKGGIYK
jgi:hypothetical protein